LLPSRFEDKRGTTPIDEDLFDLAFGDKKNTHEWHIDAPKDE